MTALNTSFYFVIEKLIELQKFFITQGWALGRFILIVAISTMAINYALNGTGLKENIIKLLKATVFFVVAMNAYPRAVNWITYKTFDMARNSTYSNMSGYLNEKKLVIKESSKKGEEKTYSSAVLSDPNFFGSLIVTREFDKKQYTVVAPAAALKAVLLVAGECIRYANEAPPNGKVVKTPNFGAIFKGLICAFFVIITGCFAVLEYLIAFLEFMFISSVGIILFPLSLWDGTKFMAEKFISALLGFFIKLLFCTICIFLMLYGFITLASQFASKPFTGGADELIIIFFTCLIFLYICKSAPGLAQSLLTGAPSLNAAGAVGAAAMAVGTMAGIAGAGARTVVGSGATMAKAGGAYAGASEKSGGGLSGFAAGLGAAGKSFGSTAAGYGGDLTRSLMARPLVGSLGGGGGGGGGGSGGHSRYDEARAWLQSRNADGSRKTIGEFYRDEYNAGKETGAASVQGVPTGQIGNITPVPAASGQTVPNRQIGNVPEPDKAAGTA